MARRYKITRFTVSNFSRMIRERNNRDWDTIIAITGNRGVGKSTLGVKINRRYKRKFCLRKDVVYSGRYSEVFDRIVNADKKEPLMFDEAITLFYKMNFQQRSVKDIKVLFDKCRYKNLFVTLILPRLDDLLESYRNNLVTIWIHVYKRGKAAIFMRNDVPGNKDPFNLKKLEKIGRGRFLHGSALLGVMKKLPGFQGVLYFGDMHKNQKKHYKSLVAEFKFGDDRDNVNEFRRGFRRLVTVLNKGSVKKLINVEGKKNFSYAEIAELTGLSAHKVSKEVKAYRDYENKLRKRKIDELSSVKV